MKKLLLSLLTMTSLVSYAQDYKGTTSFGTINIETIIASELYNQNELITGGLFQSYFEIGPYEVLFNGGNADAYFAKYNAEGEIVMMKTFGGWADESVTDVTSDNEGNYYITGYFQGHEDGGIPFDADPSEEGVFVLNQTGAILTRDCFIIKLDPNGDFLWAKQISNTEYASAEDSKTIAVDNQGGVYIGGSFAQADFNTGGTDTVPNIVLTKSGKNEGFLLKLDAETGNFVWLNHWYGGAIAFENIVVDEENNALVAAGTFTRTMNPGTDSITFTGPLRDASGFLTRFSLDGEMEWVTTFGGEGKIITDELLLLDNGDILVGGRFGKTAIFAPNDTVNEVECVGLYDLWWSGFDAAGNFQYNKTFGGTGLENMGSFQQDKNGNLLLTVIYADTSRFTSSNESVELISQGQGDIALLNLTTTGEYIDNLTIGGTGTHGLAKAFVNDNGDVLLSGNYTESVDFDPYEGEDIHTSEGSYDGFISRFEWSAVTTSINKLERNMEMNVFPNPANNLIYVSGNQLNAYSIFATNGKLMKTGAIVNQQISLTFLPSGMYFLKATDNQGNQATSRFIKQ